MTTYYVSNAGSDSNNGTSSGTSWQTFAKLNSTTFAAGDIIQLNKGDTFSGTQWTFLGTGTSVAPIWIQSYGSGAKPIIDCQLARLGIVITTKPYVYVDGIDFRNANDGGALKISTLTTPFLVQNCNFQGNARTSNNGALFITECSAGTNPTLGTSVGVTRDTNGIVVGSGGRVTNCTWGSNDNNGIFCGKSPDIEIDHNSIIGVFTGTVAGDGIQMDGTFAGVSGRYTSNYWVHHNTVDQTGSTTTKGCFTAVPTETSGSFTGGLAEYNVMRPTWNTWGVDVGNNAAVAQYNIVVGGGGNGVPSVGCSGLVAAQDQILRYNIVVDSLQALGGNGHQSNLRIIHNTVLRSTYRAVYLPDGSTGAVIKNNVIWCSTMPTSSPMLRYASTDSVVEDYHILGPEQTGFITYGGVDYATLAAYVAASTQGAHTSKTDPLVLNDGALQHSSAAWGGGVALTSVGQVGGYNGAPNIGAWDSPYFPVSISGSAATV